MAELYEITFIKRHEAAETSRPNNAFWNNVTVTNHKLTIAQLFLYQVEMNRVTIKDNYQYQEFGLTV